MVAPLTGEVIVAVGSVPTVKLLTTVVVPVALLAVTLNVWLPVPSDLSASGEVGHGLSTASLSH